MDNKLYSGRFTDRTKTNRSGFCNKQRTHHIAPVISGEELKVTFTVNVFTSGSGNLKLSTNMQKPTEVIYWELVPGDYDLGAVIHRIRHLWSSVGRKELSR